jgi:hypothetical protein
MGLRFSAFLMVLNRLGTHRLARVENPRFRVAGESRANRTLLSSVWAAAAVPASVLTAARKLNIRGSCGVSEDLQIELRKTFSMSDLEGLRGYNLRHHGIGRSNASGTL